MRRRKIFNWKRTIRSTVTDAELAALVESVSYGGNPEHKRNPGDYGLSPRAAWRRPDKALCDGAGIFRRADAERLLQEGLRQGLVSEQWRGQFPQNIWSVTENDEPVARMLHKLRTRSLVYGSASGFCSVGRSRGYGAPSQNPLAKQYPARSSREFMQHAGLRRSLRIRSRAYTTAIRSRLRILFGRSCSTNGVSYEGQFSN